jgi:alpha-tubulin suppressor-like RCC1 family protein
MFGAGSNEHNQLLLTSSSSGRGVESDIHENGKLNNGHDDDKSGNLNGSNDDERLEVYYCRQEVHELTEMLLVVPRMQDDKNGSTDENDPPDHHPRSLHAGGGHSALLTYGGDLFLWGWNDAGQLGRRRTTPATTSSPFINLVPPLSSMKVAAVALGHTHTLVIEKGSGHLFGFGEDNRGQVSGRRRCTRDGTATIISQHAPRRIRFGLFEKEGFIHVAAGLFHSAAITKETGELVTWGCGRFGQCLCVDETNPHQHDVIGESTVGKWHPPDGCKLVQVACGRRHTVVLDEYGRVWTVGDNKYGQLGRDGKGETLSMTEPQLVDGPLGQVGSGCCAIYSGWSHIIAITCDADDRETGVKLYGWGRNDKGQLGTGTQSTHQTHVFVPHVLEPPLLNTGSIPSCKKEVENSIHAACCGAESSHVIDAYGSMYSTGWNEHGNLAIGQISDDGNSEDHYFMNWTVTTGADVIAPPPPKLGRRRKIFAAGGAHLITLAA